MSKTPCYLMTALLVALLFFLPTLSTPAASEPEIIERVSVSTSGEEGTGSSDYPVISADGRHVAFNSTSENLVADDTNHFQDIFIRDRQTGKTERISISSRKEQGNGGSITPTISADGRYVSFASQASNLVDGDTNNRADIFVHDRESGVTKRVSVSSHGEQADQDSFRPFISANGRYITFFSRADNLASSDTNGRFDVFVHDRLTGITEQVSVSSDGGQGDWDSYNPSISADGHFVAFNSAATNLVAGDTNGKTDIFVFDRQTRLMERVSITNQGDEADNGSVFPSISADGRYVTFYSVATNLVSGDTNGNTDIFLFDRQKKEIRCISTPFDGSTQSNGDSGYPSITADGSSVTFSSEAFNLVTDDLWNGWTDIFVSNAQAGNIRRVSISSTGDPGNAQSLTAAISANRRYVAFASFASNLVVSDTNGLGDIFVVDLCPDGSCAYLPAMYRYNLPKIVAGD